MSFARGFARGFLKQGLEEKAARDQAHAEMVKELGSEFREASKLFRAEEENTQKRFKLIDEKLGTQAALYASYNGLTTSDAGMNLMFDAPKDFLKELENFDFQGYDYNTAKSGRLMSFKNQNEDAIKTINKNQGSDKFAEFYLKDQKEVFRPDLDLPKMSKFGKDSKNFDILNSRHATEANRFSGDFDTYFYNRNLGTYMITGLDKDNPVAPLIADLLSDYDDAVNRGYTGGQLQYARDKFINKKLSEVGIENFPRPGYDDLPEAKTIAKKIDPNLTNANLQTENLITESKAKKIDPEKVPAKKFDASKSPGKKYDPKKSPGIRVTDESGSIMNEARQAISSISRSTTLSDEQKEEAIANVRAAAKEEIKKIGLDPDNFSF